MVSRTRVAWSLYLALYGFSRAMLLSTMAYAESTSPNTCARVASLDCLLLSMSMRVRCFSPWFRSKMRRGMVTLAPRVWIPLGLLLEELYVYHAPKVGSVDPFAAAS